MLALLLESGAPLDVADVAAALGGHPNTARGHLEALADRGFVRRIARATGRRGRPRLAYEATARGHLALAPTGLEQLLQAFAEHLSTVGDPSAHAEAVGRIWGSLLARRTDADSATDEVLALLEHVGFSPHRDPGVAGLRVALRTCPLLDAARAHPEVVCEVHRGMVSGALAAQGQPSASVALQPFAEPGACRLEVAFPS